MGVWRGFGGILGERVFGSRIFDVGHSQEVHLRPKAITDVALSYRSSCHIHQTCVLTFQPSLFLSAGREWKVPR